MYISAPNTKHEIFMTKGPRQTHQNSTLTVINGGGELETISYYIHTPQNITQAWK